jgi:serine/threonine protein kinase
MSSPTDPRSSSNPVPLNTVTGGSPPPSLVPVDVGVVGAFRLTRELGRGGMGVVYEAEDEVLKRRVALKLMNAQTAADEGFRERFLREGRAVAALKSDHIVSVYAAGAHDGQLYLAMEYIDGPTLEGWLVGRTVTIEHVLWVARDLLSGLAAAHAKGLIHRDIKPGNMMIDEATGRLKLLDFGLVRDVSVRPGGAQATATVGALGTPSYMSPEQAREQKLDARTDLFSAGVVLYRLVKGKSPFARDTVADTMCAVLTEPPPPLTGVPRALSQFIARLMSREPDGRPADAGAALAELRDVEEALEQQGGVTEPDFETPPRPRRTLPLVLAGVAVLLAVVAGVLLTRGKPKGEAAQSPQAVLPQPQPQPDPPVTPESEPKVEPKDDTTPATAPKVEPKLARPLAPAEVLKLIVADIDARPGPKAAGGKPSRLYLFAPHLAPGSSLLPAERADYRAALDAMGKRLRTDAELLRPLDADRTVFAVEPQLGPRVPDGLFADYPYGLTFEQPDSARRDDELVRGYTGPVAFVRADWFVRHVARRMADNRPVFVKAGQVPKAAADWARRWELMPMTVFAAADELGAEREAVKDAIRRTGPLTKTYGLGPLLDGKTVTRAKWESVEFATSAFQELARELGVGVPKLAE